MAAPIKLFADKTKHSGVFTRNSPRCATHKNMDLGFARRNVRRNRHRQAGVRIEVLLARLAAAQSQSPTARIQAGLVRPAISGQVEAPAIVDVFAPCEGASAERSLGSFSRDAAHILTQSQGT